MRNFLITLSITGLMLTPAGPAHADAAPRMQTVPVMWHAQAVAFEEHIDAGPVAGATASLVATSSGVSARLSARDLEPGHAYTLWFVLVNNPGACDPRPCTGPDILTNPAVDSQVAYGAGQVAGNSGTATFSTRFNAGPVAGWLPGRALDDPLLAEYHLVVNDHGPMHAAHMPDMIRTYRGGCSDDSPFPPIFPDAALADGEPGPNRCLLYQVAVFQP